VRTRRSAIAFDSVGTPLYMTLVRTTTDSLGQERKYGLVLRLYPERRGTRIIFANQVDGQLKKPGFDSSDGDQPREEPLTAGELSKGNTLALWFWKRRCMAKK
jgi:hypothetical protein